MKIDNETVDRIAALAKLSFSGDKKAAIRKDLENILDLCEKLGDLDTESTPPLIFMSDETNRLSDDKPTEPAPRKEALKNAPEKDSDYIKVPAFDVKRKA